MGVEPRVAQRYLNIGGGCLSQEDNLPEDLLKLLPCDLDKLEAISELAFEQVPDFLKLIDCKHASRGAVRVAVKRLRGDQPAASDEPPVSVKDVKKRWQDYVRRMVEAIAKLPDGDVDNEVRKHLLDEFASTFAELEDLLSPSDDSPESSDEEDEQNSLDGDDSSVINAGQSLDTNEDEDVPAEINTTVSSQRTR